MPVRDVARLLDADVGDRTDVIHERLERLQEQLAATADAVAAAGARPVGPPGGHYDNALFTDGAGRMTVYLPADRDVRDGRVAPLVLPARELAVTVHRGGHGDIDVTYGRLGAHLARHALVVDGPVHETYLVGPRDTDAAAAWRTEIGWPVFTTVGRSATA